MKLTTAIVASVLSLPASALTVRAQVAPKPMATNHKYDFTAAGLCFGKRFVGVITVNPSINSDVALFKITVTPEVSAIDLQLKEKLQPDILANRALNAAEVAEDIVNEADRKCAEFSRAPEPAPAAPAPG